MRQLFQIGALLLIAGLMLLCSTQRLVCQDISKAFWVRCGQSSETSIVKFLSAESVLVGEAGRLKIYDYPSGLLKGLMYVPGNSVFAGDVLRDGSLVYVGGLGLEVWDCRELKWVKDLERDSGRVSVVRISPDERYLAVAWGDVFQNIPTKTVLYSLPDGNRLGELPGDSATITALIFTPGSDTLISFDDDGIIHLWDVAERRDLLVRAEFSGNLPGLSPDGHFLTVEGDLGLFDTIQVLDVWNNLARVGAYTSDIGITGFGSMLMYSPDGEYFLAGSGRGVLVFRTADGVLDSWLPVYGSVATLTFSPDGSDLVVGAGSGINEIRIWHKEQWQSKGDTIYEVEEAPALSDFDGFCQKVVFSRDGRLVAGEPYGTGIINIYETATGKRSGRVFTGFGSPAFTFTPDGTRMVAQSQGKLRISPVDQWQAHPVEHRDEPGRVYDLTFSPDGKYLAVSNAGYIRLWNGGIDSVVREFFDSANNNVVFAPDSRSMFYSTLEGIVRRQDVETGEILQELPDRYDQPWLSLSPDGKLLACGDFIGNLAVWDLETTSLRWSTLRDGWVSRVVFSTNGRYLYVGDQFHDLLVFDALLGDSVYEYNGYPSAVYTVAASSDGRYVATGLSDGMLVYRTKGEWSDVPWRLPETTPGATASSSRMVAELGTGRLHLPSGSAAGKIEAKVFDLHGAYIGSVAGRCNNEGVIDITLGGLSPGFYLLSITDQTGARSAISVIVPG